MSLSLFFFFFLLPFSFIALADSAKGQRGSEQEEEESCLMTEAGMSLPFPLQSLLSPAPFLSPPNKSLLTPSLVVELGWVGGSEDGSEDIGAGWPGEEELGTWQGHRVAMPVLFIERCG